MSAAVKVLLGGAAVAGLGGTGVWLLYRPGSPECRTLDQDSGFSSNQESYKFAKDHARFFVGTGDAQTDSKPEGNGDWWEWAFRNRYKKEEAKGGFRNLEAGAKDTGKVNKSLQEKCDAAYKADATNTVGTANEAGSDANKFWKDQIWLYCGVSSTKPKMIGDMNGADDQDKKNIGEGGIWKGKSGETNKTALLAIHDPSNKEAWDYLDRRFEKEKTTGGTGFFDNTNNGATIKDRCARAYGEETSDSDGGKPSETDLYKWCSLKGSKSA